MTAVPAQVGGKPTGGESTSNLQTLSRDYTNLAGQVVASDAYFDLPTYQSQVRGAVAQGADLIVGYNEGYRVSWDAAVGRITESIIDDNAKAWSGDHCVDPVLVPGILFANRAIAAENPGIEDLAPTALELFGIRAPGWMEGRSLLATGGTG